MIDFIKDNKKVLIIISVLVILIIVAFFFIKSENEVYIEIASEDVSYTFAPNGQTILNLKQGDQVDLNVITKSLKKALVKCSSTNESIISFNSKTSFTAQSVGEGQVYCDLLDNRSNYIDIVITQ